MKKLAIVFIIVIFVVCAFFGYKTAASLFQGSQSSSSTTQVQNNIQQQNFLLIHVNDLTLEKPVLISVWVVFIYHSDPPQLMFVPLYPSFDSKVQTRLDDRFGLTKDGKISSSFITQISKSFDMKTSGYVLTDDSGASLFTQWLTNQQEPVAYSPAVTDQEKLAQRMNGQAAYQQFCQLVNSGQVNGYFSAINWSSLLVPKHFVTDISFESMALTSDQIIRATSPVKCDVLSSE
jgi:hypothetical protein